jgi:hypothetical protein
MGRHSAGSSEETKDAVAKVGFAAFMAAAMGPVGILIAALAVGVEQAWNGDAGRTTSEDLSRDRVEQERQWLAEDRAWRDRLRADRQRWIDDGADPVSEPSRPSKAEAAGRWWRRLWARMVVFADDFKRGWRDGWDAAKRARDNGADWWEAARTRPDPDEDETPADDDRGSPGEGPADPTPDETVPGPCTSTDPHQRHLWSRVGDAAIYECPGVPEPAKTDDDRGPEPAPADADDNPHQEPQTDDQGEEPVTSPNGAPSQGESNATVLGHKLRGIGNNLTKVEAGVDDLGRLADALAAQVREANEFATHTGQVAATKQAMDAANAVVAKLRALVAAASAAAVEAVEQVAAARGSLRVAESAEDSLRSAGGTGDAVATAKAA